MERRRLFLRCDAAFKNFDHKRNMGPRQARLAAFMLVKSDLCKEKDRVEDGRTTFSRATWCFLMYPRQEHLRSGFDHD